MKEGRLVRDLCLVSHLLWEIGLYSCYQISFLGFMRIYVRDASKILGHRMILPIDRDWSDNDLAEIQWHQPQNGIFPKNDCTACILCTYRSIIVESAAVVSHYFGVTRNRLSPLEHVGYRLISQAAC